MINNIILASRSEVRKKILNDNGIDCEVVDLLSLSPLDESILLESVSKTNRLIVVDEDTPRCSMASEVAAVVVDQAFDYLDAPIKRVTGPHTPVPYNKALETAFMPDANEVIVATKKLFLKAPISIKNSPTKPLVPGKPIAASVNIINNTAYLGIKDTTPP